MGFLASRLSSTALSRMEESSDRMLRLWSTEETVASNFATYARKSAAVMFLSASSPRCGTM